MAPRTVSRLRGLMVALSAVVALAVACDARQAPPSPTSNPASSSDVPVIPIPSVGSPDPIAEAIEWRRFLDMRSDEAYVHALAQDSAAVARAEFAGFRFPMTELEILALLRRNQDMGEISRMALAYARTQPTEFAGAYVDTENSRYVFLVTGSVATHRARLYERLPAGSPVVVAQVRWSLAELESIVERIRKDDAFFTTLGVFAITNIVEAENIIEIELNADDPADPARVHARYGDDPRIRVRIVGRGPWNGGYGTVIIRVTDGEGRSVNPEGVVCMIVADDYQAWSSDEPYRVPVDGACRFTRVGVTGVEAQIRMGTAAGRVLGAGRGVVSVNGTETITVVLDEMPR